MNELFESSYLSAMSEMNNKLREENNQLQSNWNSLREWINTRIQANIIRTGMRSEELLIVLDKMNELEGKNKE